jgi:predicted nucleic acid-binding protein
LIAADTSSLRRYWTGASGHDVDLVDEALARRELVVAPVVLTELLSDPGSATIMPFALALRVLDVMPGYWLRTGELRARLLGTGRKAKLADSLIAQACIDHGAPLVTHDRDFRHFVKEGLKLL